MYGAFLFKIALAPTKNESRSGAQLAVIFDMAASNFVDVVGYVSMLVLIYLIDGPLCRSLAIAIEVLLGSIPETLSDFDTKRSVSQPVPQPISMSDLHSGICFIIDGARILLAL